MYRVMIDEEIYYFKNKSTLIDFLDDNLPLTGSSSDDILGFNRTFHIRLL